MDITKIGAFVTGQKLISLNWTPKSFYLGAALPEFSGCRSPFDIGIDDDRPVFIVAATRAGKGTGILINNLIGWPGGAFCIDPKGELATLTAIRRGTPAKAQGSGTSVRKFLGQEVAALDPFGQVIGPARVCLESYNPLDDIKPGSPSFVSEIRSISSAVVVGESKENAHFSDMARVLLAGALETCLITGKARSLSAIADIVRGSWSAFTRILEDCGGPLSTAALGAIEKFSKSREGNAVYTTLSRNLTWIDEPRMRKHLKGSGFSMMEAVQNGGTVYTVLPPDEMEEQKRWLRLLLAMAIRAKLRQGVFRRDELQSLFVVDEMYSLGAMKELEEGISYLAGYGVKLVCVVQNLGQLKELYRKNWQTFLGNAGAMIAFGLADNESAEYVSKRIGQDVAIRESKSSSRTESKGRWLGGPGLFGRGQKAEDVENKGGENWSEGQSWSERLEHVLRPEEVILETARENRRLIALVADGKPLFLERLDYFNRRDFEELYESERSIKTVESALRKTRGA